MEVLCHLQLGSVTVHCILNMSDKVKQAIADASWQLLQHFVCRDYKTSQRGNGAGGVHSRHNSHRLYPIPMTEMVKKEDHKGKCNKKKVTVKMVSPAQATVEQAKSESKQLKESAQGTFHHSLGKRTRGQTSVKPKKKKKYSGTVFQDEVY